MTFPKFAILFRVIIYNYLQQTINILCQFRLFNEYIMKKLSELSVSTTGTAVFNQQRPPGFIVSTGKECEITEIPRRFSYSWIHLDLGDFVIRYFFQAKAPLMISDHGFKHKSNEFVTINKQRGQCESENCK